MELDRRVQAVSRAAGVISIVAAFWIYAQQDIRVWTLLAVLTAIVAMVAPEAVDRLPWGPNKPG